MRFTEREIQEALCERHTAAIQEKLNRGRVAIAGLGGLGSNIAFSLARIGTGHLHLIDFDRVDLTNLNRQQYLMRHVGMFKTDALKNSCWRSILIWISGQTASGSLMKMSLHFLKKTPSCAKPLMSRKIRPCLVNGILENYRDLIIISASGMAGYGNSNTILSKKITSRFYLCGDGVSDSRKGPA